jgi:hypothetical protein
MSANIAPVPRKLQGCSAETEMLYRQPEQCVGVGTYDAKSAAAQLNDTQVALPADNADTCVRAPSESRPQTWGCKTLVCRVTARTIFRGSGLLPGVFMVMMVGGGLPARCVDTCNRWANGAEDRARCTSAVGRLLQFRQESHAPVVTSHTPRAIWA